MGLIERTNAEETSQIIAFEFQAGIKYRDPEKTDEGVSLADANPLAKRKVSRILT